MVVYEVGVISVAGLPVFHIDLRPGVSGDPLMTAGFLTALQQFVNSTFSDETQSFAMKKFVIYVSQITLLKEQASVYVISERGKSQKAIQERIKSVSKKIAEIFPSLTEEFEIAESPQGKEILTALKGEWDALVQVMEGVL